MLRKLGNPVPQNTLYMTVKVLLERIAPVLIDGFAITSLLKLVDNSESTGELSDIPNVVATGMKLLLVS